MVSQLFGGRHAHTISDAHRSDIYSIAVTASQVLSASGSPSIHIYSAEGQITHAERVVDEHQYPLIQILEGVHPLGSHHICTSLDGRVAASAGFNGELKLWKCSEYGRWSSAGEVVPEDKKVSENWTLALSVNGQYLVCTTHDGCVNIYDTRTISGAGATVNSTQFETQGSFGMSVDISADGSMIASVHQNGGIYIVINRTARLAHSLAGLAKPVRSVKFNITSKLLAAAGDGRLIVLYDPQTGEQIAKLMGHGGWIMSLDWNWTASIYLAGPTMGKLRLGCWRGGSAWRRTLRARSVCGVSSGCLTGDSRTETLVTAGAGGTWAFF
ncbi:Ski complex subunit Rec14 [Friedmanniomyces endolithicus]|nr:Ski complex subunit Rec14 [Friedmanniomyces endolithicus]